MRLTDVPPGATVFLDANILVYAFTSEPAFQVPCLEFLERIESREIQGVFSAGILSEVAHRVMTLEACQTFGWSYAGIARQLRRHPNEVSTLRRYRRVLDEVLALGPEVIPIAMQDVISATDISQQHGLLSGDALIVALMRSRSLVNIASNDADFDRVPGLVRFSPT